MTSIAITYDSKREATLVINTDTKEELVLLDSAPDTELAWFVAAWARKIRHHLAGKTSVVTGVCDSEYGGALRISGDALPTWEEIKALKNWP